MALYADVHPPTQYESTQLAHACMNSSCSSINSTTPIELPESSTFEPQLSTAATSTLSVSATISPSITAAPAVPGKPTARLPVRKNELENVLPAKHQVVTEHYANTTDHQMSCDVFKELDRCRSKILPQQRKYGFQNTKLKTMYHCNCTTGFLQTLTKQKQLTKVQIFLLGHVSQSCFLPEDCANTCSADVVNVEFPWLDQGSAAEMEEQYHLQMVKLKVRRHNMRLKTKDRLLRLSKLCRLMTQAKHPKDG